jgi:hypothetical protein
MVEKSLDLGCVWAMQVLLGPHSKSAPSARVENNVFINDPFARKTSAKPVQNQCKTSAKSAQMPAQLIIGLNRP